MNDESGRCMNCQAPISAVPAAGARYRDRKTGEVVTCRGRDPEILAYSTVEHPKLFEALSVWHDRYEPTEDAP